MSNVVVELTRGDLISFNLRWLWSWRRIWPPFLMLLLLVAAFVIYKHGVPKSAWNWFVLLMAGAGGAVGAIVISSLFSLLVVALNARNMPGLLGRHEYQFVADGLLERTDANETLIKWGGAHAVVRGETFLQIDIGPGLAHILPRRAFEDARAFDEFCEQAVRLVRTRVKSRGTES